MFREKFKITGNIFSIEITRSVTDEDFHEICREIRQAGEMEKIRVVVFMTHYPTLNSAEDLYYDLRFVMLYSDRIEKVAVVCDKSWKRTWVGLFGLFSRVPMEFFETSEMHCAESWIAD